METCLVYLSLSEWMIFVDLVFAKMAFTTSRLRARFVKRKANLWNLFRVRAFVSLLWQKTPHYVNCFALWLRLCKIMLKCVFWARNCNRFLSVLYSPSCLHLSDRKTTFQTPEETLVSSLQPAETSAEPKPASAPPSPSLHHHVLPKSQLVPVRRTPESHGRLPSDCLCCPTVTRRHTLQQAPDIPHKFPI